MCSCPSFARGTHQLLNYLSALVLIMPCLPACLAYPWLKTERRPLESLKPPSRLSSPWRCPSNLRRTYASRYILPLSSLGSASSLLINSRLFSPTVAVPAQVCFSPTAFTYCIP
jgi:hypothetical protein